MKGRSEKKENQNKVVSPYKSRVGRVSKKGSESENERKRRKRKREKEKREEEKRERKKEKRGKERERVRSQHTSTPLQVMFALKHLNEYVPSIFGFKGRGSGGRMSGG